MAKLSLLRGKGSLLMGGESISSDAKGYWGYNNARNPPSTIRFPQARHADGDGAWTRAKTIQRFCVGIVAATWTLGSNHSFSTAEAATLAAQSFASVSNRYATLESNLFNAEGPGSSDSFQPLFLSGEDCRGGSTELASDESAFRQVNTASDEDFEKQTKHNGVCDIRCFRADPVCGTNGVTYWCGAPEAKCAGVDVAYNNKCVKGDLSLAEKAIRAVQSFFSSFLGLVNGGSLGKEDFHNSSGPKG